MQFGKIPKTRVLGSGFSYTLSMQIPQVTFLLWRKASVSSAFPWALDEAVAAAAEAPCTVVSLEEVS